MRVVINFNTYSQILLCWTIGEKKQQDMQMKVCVCVDDDVLLLPETLLAAGIQSEAHYVKEGSATRGVTIEK